MLAGISKYLKYIYKTKSVWWYTASAKTRARYIRTLLGSLWLGISNLLFVGVLGFVYGVVFKAENFKDYYIYLGLGFSIWNTIGGSINAAPNIFTNNSSSLMNTNINPLFFVLEEWCSNSDFLAINCNGNNLPKHFGYQIFINLIYIPIHFVNLIIFIFWAPLIICLLAARYTDIYQMVPICSINFSNVTHSLSREKSWKVVFCANFNPIYKYNFI